MRSCRSADRQLYAIARINRLARRLFSIGRPAGLPAELRNQAIYGIRLAPHAQERALAVGALLQHRAGGEDLPALLLRRPGQEELGLDEALPEKRPDRLAHPGDVGLISRAHHHAARDIRAQRELLPR